MRAWATGAGFYSTARCHTVEVSVRALDWRGKRISAIAPTAQVVQSG